MLVLLLHFSAASRETCLWRASLIVQILSSVSDLLRLYLHAVAVLALPQQLNFPLCTRLQRMLLDVLAHLIGKPNFVEAVS
jgi:hypothetical protein